MTSEDTKHPDVAAFFSEHRHLHVSWLNRLHTLAELSLEEHETSKFVLGILREFSPSLVINQPFRNASTGIIALHTPTTEKDTPILLRADMDALPITGAKISPTQLHPDCHHACGHDGHMTCLLAAAHWLHSYSSAISRKVVLLFQPAEETGGVLGRSGASMMLHEGLLDTLHADVHSVFAVHCWPGAPEGDILVGPGCMMGASGRFEIVLRGSGGHAATPGPARSEPLLAACALVSSAQSITARLVDAFDTTTLAFTEVKNIGSGAFNICPEDVAVRGTVRASDSLVRDNILNRLGKMAEGIANAYGCHVTNNIRKGYPATVNSADGAAAAREAALRVHEGDEKHVHTVGTGVGMAKPSMCAEDFSFLLEKRSGAYVWLGNGVDSPGLHTKALKFSEEAIAYGAHFFVELMLRRSGKD